MRGHFTDRISLTIFFSGIKSGKTYVHPVVLSQYDIVLTTYETLRREINFTDLTDEKRLVIFQLATILTFTELQRFISIFRLHFLAVDFVIRNDMPRYHVH